MLNNVIAILSSRFNLQEITFLQCKFPKDKYPLNCISKLKLFYDSIYILQHNCKILTKLVKELDANIHRMTKGKIDCSCKNGLVSNAIHLTNYWM